MIDAKEALNILKKGNKRFSQGVSEHPNRDEELREKLSTGQTPIAAIISCSDSRVPIEIIFDSGIGDLFVIRSAGHVLSKEALGSIDYAVSHLGVKLVIILGHENCGAIKTSVNLYEHGNIKNISENLFTLISHICPVLNKLDTQKDLNGITKEFIKYQIEDFKKKTPELEEKIKNNELTVIGGYYNLKSGIVDFFE